MGSGLLGQPLLGVVQKQSTCGCRGSHLRAGAISQGAGVGLQSLVKWLRRASDAQAMGGSLFFIFIFLYWESNSGAYACKAGAMPLSDISGAPCECWLLQKCSAKESAGSTHLFILIVLTFVSISTCLLYITTTFIVGSRSVYIACLNTFCALFVWPLFLDLMPFCKRSMALFSVRSLFLQLPNLNILFPKCKFISTLRLVITVSATVV